MADGIQAVTLADPATGGSSTMTGVLTYGAGPADTIVSLTSPNPATPVGGQLVSPIRVQVLAPDGTTPVAGASVLFTSTPVVAFSACGGGASCTVLTDQSGQVSSNLTVLPAGGASFGITVTAKLAPASYANPQQVQTTIKGIVTSLDISLSSPPAFIAQGAAVNLPITARVLSNGSPVSGRTIHYALFKGQGVLGPASVSTDANGNATAILQSASVSGDLALAVCVEPGDAPCQTWNATAVPVNSLQLQPVFGTTQVVAVGAPFAAVTVQVTDQAVPPHAVLGASVFFQTVVGRSPNNEPIVWIAQSGISQPTIPVILAQSQATVLSDSNGLASIQPTAGGIPGAVLILGVAAVQGSTLDFELQSLLPVSNP